MSNRHELLAKGIGLCGASVYSTWVLRALGQCGVTDLVSRPVSSGWLGC